MAEALFRTIHLMGVLGLAAGALIAIAATRPRITPDDVQGLDKIYLVSWLSLLLVLGAGMVLWLWVGKPAAFFSNNPVFHVKMGLFGILTVLLIWPAWFFRRQARRRATEQLEVPVALRRLQKAVIPLLLALPVLAYLMARGIGY